MAKIKGWKGYVHHGFQGVARNYHKIHWGNGKKPKSVEKTPFKTTYKF